MIRSAFCIEIAVVEKTSVVYKLSKAPEQKKIKLDAQKLSFSCFSSLNGHNFISVIGYVPKVRNEDYFALPTSNGHVHNFVSSG